LEGIGRENVVLFNSHLVHIFHDHLENFLAIWHILWSFGTFLPIRYCGQRPPLSIVPAYSLHANLFSCLRTRTLQYRHSYNSPTGLATLYIFDCLNRSANARATIVIVIHPSFKSYVMRGIRLWGFWVEQVYYVSNSWPNLRVHAPQYSGYHMSQIWLDLTVKWEPLVTQALVSQQAGASGMLCQVWSGNPALRHCWILEYKMNGQWIAQFMCVHT
jgi:hypothetical protein